MEDDNVKLVLADIYEQCYFSYYNDSLKFWCA